MQVQSYLNKIGINKIKAPSLEFLAELQNRHLLSVPFEDLDIPERRIELDLDKVYEKIIPTKRGGFCYELNGLFHWLLTSLGFRVDMLSARVFNSQNNEFGPEFDHMTLLVQFPKVDKYYLADVGFGDSFRTPIEIYGGEVQDVSGHYRIKGGHNTSVLQLKNGNDWIPQYSFSFAPRKFSDYQQMCEFQQDNPSSHFRIRKICTIATETGRITLSNYSLTITDGKSKNKITFDNQEEFNMYLKKYFDIEM
ncbi:MAG: arylamine N-acetyltransferase [Ignavibacteriaceae bacterium]